MRLRIFILTTVILWPACKNSDHIKDASKQSDTLIQTNSDAKTVLHDTIKNVKARPVKLTVLVLPPYDEIANEGISPDVQKYLEELISKDTGLVLIPFPLKKLMQVPYHNVFDKKYCKPIVEKVKTDIMVMSKIDLADRKGQMASDKWNLRVRIYNTHANKQINSELKADNMTSDELQVFLKNQIRHLTAEIKRM